MQAATYDKIKHAGWCCGKRCTLHSVAPLGSGGSTSTLYGFWERADSRSRPPGTAA